MSLMKLLASLGKDIAEFIKAMESMENPEFELLKLRGYEYKGKKWDWMILVRDAEAK